MIWFNCLSIVRARRGLFFILFVSNALHAAPGFETWEEVMRIKALANICINLEPEKPKDSAELLSTYNRFVRKNLSTLIDLREKWVQQHGEDSAALLATQASARTELVEGMGCADFRSVVGFGSPRVAVADAAGTKALAQVDVLREPEARAERPKSVGKSGRPALVASQPMLKQFPPVHFVYASSRPDSKSEDLIRELAAFLSNQPNFVVEVVGHTSADGTPKGDAQWSRLRAESVAALLRSAGVTSDRIKVTSAGSKYANTPPDGPEHLRALDRRVEFVLSSRAPPAAYRAHPAVISQQ